MQPDQQQIAATTPERELSVKTALIMALHNIAQGYWNAGREPGKDLSAREYARETLKDLGFWGNDGKS